MKTTLNRFVLALGLGALLAGAAGAQDVTGAGASFPAPLYAKWAADYNKATGVKINYQSVGSGAGIKQIDAKTVDFVRPTCRSRMPTWPARASCSSPP